MPIYYGDMMNKLVASFTIACLLGVSACDDESIEDVQQNVIDNNSQTLPTASVVFDPAADEPRLSVPNDLLFKDSIDGTLNIPVADENDFSDPQNALNILDGWSTQNPFVLSIDFPQGVALNTSSLQSAAGIRIFESIMGGDLNDTDCTNLTRGFACKIVNELTYNVDFTTQNSDNNIAVLPLKPLKSATTYILVMTNHLQDDNGNAIEGSSTYKLVQQDVSERPLGTEEQLFLQELINSFESLVSSAGVDKESIIYSMAMTTQSVGLSLAVTKQLLATAINPDPNQVVLPAPVIMVEDAEMSVAEKLIADGLLEESNPAHESLLTLHSAANLNTATITLPYYLSAPTADNLTAPLNTWWKARCDSGATLAGLAAENPSVIPNEPISPNDGFCMAFGLRDLGIDEERNLTKFNPIPMMTALNTLDVQITVPNLDIVNALRAGLSTPLAPLVEPENGWPVVMLAHGIPSQKEHMLMTTGTLALYGLASIAIDQPLHNSRGYGAINAAIDPLAYMNLASLPTLRDNLRQSVADLLGLRFGINFLTGANIDKTQVHFLGQSLGSITGVDFLALTNTPIGGAPEAVNDMFRVQASSLSVPVQGLAHSLLDSLSFGDLIKANITMAGSEEFTATVIAAATQGGILPNGEGWNDLVIETYQTYWLQLSIDEQAELNQNYLDFAFATQTMVDAADPTNYASALVLSETPLHVIEIVGGMVVNGGINGPDRLYPNQASTMPLGGTEPLIAQLGLPAVASTLSSGENFISAAIRFGGDHSSMFSPSTSPTSPDPIVSARAYQEMQTQVGSYLSSNAHSLLVTDTELLTH